MIKSPNLTKYVANNTDPFLFNIQSIRYRASNHIFFSHLLTALKLLQLILLRVILLPFLYFHSCDRLSKCRYDPVLPLLWTMQERGDTKRRCIVSSKWSIPVLKGSVQSGGLSSNLALNRTFLREALKNSIMMLSLHNWPQTYMKFRQKYI